MSRRRRKLSGAAAVCRVRCSVWLGPQQVQSGDLGHSGVQGQGARWDDNRGPPRGCPMPWRHTSPLGPKPQVIADDLRTTRSITA